MDKALNFISNTVRGWMKFPAVFVNKLSGGCIKPNHITLVSLLGHFGVVWALWQWKPMLAAVLLAFFGIMDSLDGALARLQKSSSNRGMFFDSTSDRVKEVLVYVGLAEWAGYYYSHKNFATTHIFALIVAVCGLSLVVSYTRARGEAVLLSSKKNVNANKVFTDGVARYEVRMALIILGLLTGKILIALYVLLVLVSVTALKRVMQVSKALVNVQI